MANPKDFKTGNCCKPQKEERTYKIAWDIHKEISTPDIEGLLQMSPKDNVITSGAHDHIEVVLRACGIPHTVISPEALTMTDLSTTRALWINCTGNVWSDEAIHVIRKFVEDGGLLRTTDWGLSYVLAKAFPKIVGPVQRETPHWFTPLDAWDVDSPLLDGTLDDGSQAHWWYEGSSHVVNIIDKKAVHPLFLSGKQAIEFGTPVVAFTFKYGKGRVFHCVSHFILQFTANRTVRHYQPARNFAAEKGISPDKCRTFENIDEFTTGDIEPCYISLKLLINLLLERSIDSSMTPRKDVLRAIKNSPGGEYYTIPDMIEDTGLPRKDVVEAVRYLAGMQLIIQDRRTLEWEPTNDKAAYFTRMTKRENIKLLLDNCH